MADAKRDSNRIPTLLATSNADGITPVVLWADPVTHRLLVDNAAASGTVTTVSVTTANGVSGTVATATTTPAITLTLGAITPTSVNGLTITTTTGTFTLTNAKTLTVSNTLTLTATDGSTLAIGSGGTLGTGAYATIANYLPLAGGTLTGDLLGAVSHGSTGTRLTKVWSTDIESTNAPTVGGVAVPTISSTSTLTNKRINPRLVTATSYTTDTGTSLDVSTCDQFEVTAQAGALKFNNPGGTPLGGQKLTIRIKDNGTARALTWDTQFRAMGTALPSTTVLGKTLYLGLIYNATDTKWDLVASAQEA